MLQLNFSCKRIISVTVKKYTHTHLLSILLFVYTTVQFKHACIVFLDKKRKMNTLFPFLNNLHHIFYNLHCYKINTNLENIYIYIVASLVLG